MENADIFTVDLPTGLVAKMKKLAKANHMDLQSIIIFLLEKALSQEAQSPSATTRLSPGSGNDNS